ncbi:MAG: prolyl oligopeptidase family serine peptidase [Pirellulaceae bacterium]
MAIRPVALLIALVVGAGLLTASAQAHPHSLHQFLQTRKDAEQKDAKQQAKAEKDAAVCRLKIVLRDAKSGEELAGMVRVSLAADGKFLPLKDAIDRGANWFSLDAGQTIEVPQAKLKVEALHGLQWEHAESIVDLHGKKLHAVELELRRFYDTAPKLLYSGNTHVHLRDLTRAEADNYLDVVSRGDNLDLVYVSHLRRIPDERVYITNTYTPGDLVRLSRRGVLFGWGEEHRHNFTGYGEGYGHVMFLDIKGLIRPVSIGPGIMMKGTDGRPMRTGILEAREQDATVIWCHNKFGMEDVPNWMTGVLDAQNIFDGGDHGSYEDTYYRYLNLGLKVPFSTGTDWFIYDFSRVYTPVKRPLSSQTWLESLRQGKSFITNGPLLEFSVNEADIGDTVRIDEGGNLRVRGKATGRVDFHKLQLIHNGKVIHETTSKPEGGHFVAEIDLDMPVETSGWLAMRIPRGEAKSELDRELFAHTSAIYLDVAGRPVFRADTARELIEEMKQSMTVIKEKGEFADDAERASVLDVYKTGIQVLEKRMKDDDAEQTSRGRTGKIAYPETRRGDVVDDYHGTSIADPYRWLEDPDSPETEAWVEAQNKVTFGYLDRLPQRRVIFDRLKQLWDYERFGLPRKRGERYFYTRNDGLQNQSVLYVADGLDGEPRLLLDPNKLSDDGTVHLSAWRLSDDGDYLAYGLSSAGSDWKEWKVRDTRTGEDLADDLKWIKFSAVSWKPDGSGFFYSRYDEPDEETKFTGANYYQKLYFHKLGDPQSNDRLIYERKDEKEWGFGGVVTEDGAYLIVSVWRGTERKNQIFYRDLRRDDAPMVELITGFDAEYDFLGNEGSRIWLMTDLDAPLRRIIQVDLEKPDRENWRELVPQGDAVLSDASIVGGRLLATYLKDAHSVVKRFTLEGKSDGEVKLPGLGSAGGFGGRQKQDETFFYFTSFTTPTTIYRYQVDSGAADLFRQPTVDFQPKDYTVKQVFCRGKDGTRVPMFIIHKQGLELDGENPTILYGYGGFNISLTPSFSVSNLVWLESGGVYVVANLRGGGEYGREWHEAGMQENKQNVFDDCIAAAEWLIEHKYTSSKHLAIRGGSNGGLLVGAMITQRPDLFAAAQPSVGVLDMLRYHKFTIGWAWVSDYGSADDPDEFRTLLKYSPLHNLKPGGRYPATLITTGDHDDRVVPAHSHKFAATLQAAQGGDAPVLIRIETSAGHGAGKPTEKILRESSDVLAFLADALGLDIRPKP